MRSIVGVIAGQYLHSCVPDDIVGPYGVLEGDREGNLSYGFREKDADARLLYYGHVTPHVTECFLMTAQRTNLDDQVDPDVRIKLHNLVMYEMRAKTAAQMIAVLQNDACVHDDKLALLNGLNADCPMGVFEWPLILGDPSRIKQIVHQLNQLRRRFLKLGRNARIRGFESFSANHPALYADNQLPCSAPIHVMLGIHPTTRELGVWRCEHTTIPVRLGPAIARQVLEQFAQSRLQDHIHHAVVQRLIATLQS